MTVPGALFKVIDASTRDIHITDQQKARAVSTIAHHAHNADDLRELLDMIGLTAADRHPIEHPAQTHTPPPSTPRRRQRKRLNPS